MSDMAKDLAPARELAAGNTAHVPNESAEYRSARNALLARRRMSLDQLGEQQAAAQRVDRRRQRIVVDRIERQCH